MTFRKIKLTNEVGHSVVIAEDANDYVLDQDGLDLGTVGSVQNTTQYIDAIGKHLDSVVLSPRDIAIVGWIIGPDEATIQHRKILLNKLVNPIYAITLEVGNYSIQFHSDSSIQYAREWDYNNEWMVKFQIQGTANMPLFSLKDPNIYGQTVEIMGGIHFPLNIVKNQGILLGYYPMNSIAKIANIGDVESGFVLTLTAEGGEVLNPSLNNLTTGNKIELNYRMTDRARIDISTNLGDQYIRIIKPGQIVENGLRYLTEDSSIDMKLALLMNSLEVIADEGNDFLKAKLTFSPRFLEVEGR